MSNKFQPGEETFDDVSGHKLNPRMVEDDEGTEGHKLNPRMVEDDETEGHRLSYNTAVPTDDDDVEGHKLNPR